MVNASSPDEVQSYIETWDNLRYAFHWGHHQNSPSLLVHRNHQQDAAWLSWEGLVAGIDGSVDARTARMGAGNVVRGDVILLGPCPRGWVVRWPLFVPKQPVCFNCCGKCLLNTGGVYGC